MRVLREIDVSGRKVVVKELTVGEIRAWLESKSSGGIDLIDSSLFEDFSLSDLGVLTDLPPDQVDLMTPSEIEVVLKMCKEVNARFFEMRARVAEIGRQILANQRQESAPPN